MPVDLSTSDKSELAVLLADTGRYGARIRDITIDDAPVDRERIYVSPGRHTVTWSSFGESSQRKAYDAGLELMMREKGFRRSWDNPYTAVDESRTWERREGGGIVTRASPMNAPPAYAWETKSEEIITEASEEYTLRFVPWDVYFFKRSDDLRLQRMEEDPDYEFREAGIPRTRF